MAMGVRWDWRPWLYLAGVVVVYLWEPSRTSARFRHRAGLYPKRPGGASDPDTVAKPAALSASMGFCDRKVSHRSYLVVLSVLASRVPQRKTWPGPDFDGTTTRGRLFVGRYRQYRRRVAFLVFAEAGVDAQSRAKNSDALLRPL